MGKLVTAKQIQETIGYPIQRYDDWNREEGYSLPFKLHKDTVTERLLDLVLRRVWKTRLCDLGHVIAISRNDDYEQMFIVAIKVRKQMQWNVFVFNDEGTAIDQEIGLTSQDDCLRMYGELYCMHFLGVEP